jgi:hypothetical protein
MEAPWVDFSIILCYNIFRKERFEMIYLVLIYLTLRVLGENYEFVKGVDPDWNTSYSRASIVFLPSSSIYNLFHRFLLCGRDCGPASA